VRVRHTLSIGTVALVMAIGCMETSWGAARRVDTVAAYNQFIRDHPESQFLDAARERMDYLRVKTYRTIEVYEEFRRQHDRSDLLPELRALVEPLYFQRARDLNTAQSYTSFLAQYPSGKLSARALGNRFYVEQVRGAPTPEALRSFLTSYSQSDFVAEATRTLELVDLRQKTSIRRLGVKVDIAPNVAQADRVSRGFLSLIGQAYRDRGIQVRGLRADEIAGPDLDAWVRVDYREAPASGALGGATLFSSCRVRLYHRDFETPIWDRSFDAPADHLIKGAYGRDKTVFGNAKYAFWEQFFVPVATWPTSRALTPQLSYTESLRALDVLGDRAALLLERGGVDFLDVSSPLEIKVLERYRREADLSDWRGVRMLRDDLAVSFGNDGAELIRRSDQQASRVARWEVGEVGAIRGAVLYDDATLLLAGSRGLFAVRMNRAPLVAQRLLDGEIVGLESVGRYVYVIRPDRVEVSLPKHLLMHITARRLPLGKGFRGDRVSRSGDSLFVFGRDSVVQVGLQQPTRPTIVGQVQHGELGTITDLAVSGRYRYVLGDRGLQVVEISSESESPVVEDYIQVSALDGMALKDRFALLVGGSRIEVVDLTPYSQPSPLAATRPAPRKAKKAKPVEEPEVEPAPASEAPAADAPLHDVQVIPAPESKSGSSPAPAVAPKEGSDGEEAKAKSDAEAAPTEGEPVEDSAKPDAPATKESEAKEPESR